MIFFTGGARPLNKRKTISTLRRMLTLVTEDACPGAGEAVKNALRAVHAYPEPQKAALGGLTTAKKYSKAQRAKWGKLGGRPRKRKRAREK